MTDARKPTLRATEDAKLPLPTEVTSVRRADV